MCILFRKDLYMIFRIPIGHFCMRCPRLSFMFLKLNPLHQETTHTLQTSFTSGSLSINASRSSEMEKWTVELQEFQVQLSKSDNAMLWHHPFHGSFPEEVCNPTIGHPKHNGWQACTEREQPCAGMSAICHCQAAQPCKWQQVIVPSFSVPSKNVWFTLLKRL